MHDKTDSPVACYIPFEEGELELSLVDRFRHVARSLGSQPVINFNGTSLSFAALEERSNVLAQALLEALGRGTEPVAMFFKPGALYHIAQLAVLKTGKFYVNMDPGVSQERHLLLFNDIGARVLLIDAAHESQAEAIKRALPSLQVVNVESLQFPQSKARSAVELQPDDLAAVVYTSGSTGPAQGVMLTHRNLLFIARSHGRDFKLGTADRATQVCPLWTVASNSEFFSAALSGACLYPYSIKDAGMPGYLKLLRHEQITTFTASPAVFRALFSSVKTKGQFPSVRVIRLGGERTTRSDFNLYKEVFEDASTLRLLYGSSEFVPATQMVLTKVSQFTGEVLPIGYPIEGCEIALLDEEGNEVAHGEYGEITITSEYLSPGYWRNPALTRARFRQQDPGTVRTYFTRDIGRRDASGCLHHAGRNDARIKIYGKFVSVDDVEEALLRVNGVRDAVIMPVDKPPRAVELAAFVVLHDQQLDAIGIRSELLKTLAPELVPKQIVLLSELPLLVNNKVNRLKLKEMLAESVPRP